MNYDHKTFVEVAGNQSSPVHVSQCSPDESTHTHTANKHVIT